MSEIGDIGYIMKDATVADGETPANLDWMMVDESVYRKEDTLPKQNLDVVPDLKALWSHEGQPSTNYLIPNAGAPHTMGDMSQLHGPLRSEPADILRGARLAMMRTTHAGRIAESLRTRFGSRLASVKSALAGVLAERGLLGRYYIDAADFPTCNTGRPEAAEFVRRFAGKAPYLKAKDTCQECRHANGNHCAVFNKELVVEVPYTTELAVAIERSQGKAATEGGPRARIRAAFLDDASPEPRQFSGQPNRAAAVVPADRLTKKKVHDPVALKARPILATLRREMHKGRSELGLLKTLKLSFDGNLLDETRAHWEPLFREAGVYGTVYTTQESFDSCHEGADFLARRGSKTRAIVAGPKCASCIYAQVGQCMMYGKRLVASPDEVLTAATVNAVIEEHRLVGTLPRTASQVEWGETPKAALQAIHKAASGHPGAVQSLPSRALVERAHIAGEHAHSTGGLTVREVVKTARRFLNEGLYGAELMAALKSRFEKRDLMASVAQLKPFIAEQGLQGIYYVDPTVYDDYGRGCKEASRLHRSRGVPFVKLGSACTSCVFRNDQGICRAIGRPVVEQVEYPEGKAEAQRAVLASGRSTEINFANLVNNGVSMMAEMDLQRHTADFDIELDPEVEVEPLAVEFAGALEEGIEL